MTAKTFWYIIILVVKRDTKKLDSVQTLIESLPKKKLKKTLDNSKQMCYNKHIVRKQKKQKGEKKNENN